MKTLANDVAYAARTLRKNPGFAITAIVTLALGIGASTAIFSVVNAMLLRPLPYAQPERLVLLWGELRARHLNNFPFAPGDWLELRDQGTLFEGFAGVVTFRSSLTGGNGEPESIRSAGVTPNLFSLLGARIAYGRNFVETDATPDPRPPQPAPGAAAQPQAQPPAPLVAIAILSHEFWQRRYGGDSSVIGRTIQVDNGNTQVVGIAAPGVELLFPPGTGVERTPDMYTVLRIDYSTASRLNVLYRVIGRLKPGVTLANAQAQMDKFAANLRDRFPIKKTAGLYFHVEPMQNDLVKDVRPAILALMGAVLFVLLIACANVANLLLVRASVRERELTVRAALGGSQRQLIWQMLVESFLLAGIGALIGLGLASLGIKLLVAIAPANLPRVDVVAIDPLVLAFTIGVSILSAVVFGVVPAVRASRPDIAEALRAGGRTPSLQGGRALRNGVVVAEVALSFVLLIGSGLMIRSFMALHRIDPGYDPKGVLTFFVQNARARGIDDRAAFMRLFAERLRAIPGVAAVTAASPLPLDGTETNARWGTERALSDPSLFQQANEHVVLPGYFEAMHTRLIAGRTFTEADNDTTSKSIIIDDLLAAKAFPGQPPASIIGKQLLCRINTNEARMYQILGIVEHQRHATLSEPGREALFVTDGFWGHGFAGRWAVRTSGDPARLTSAVRAELTRMDPLIPISEIQPMTAFVDRAMAQTRFSLVLIAIFGGIAALLAAVGLYGVLSTLVRQRTAEIGVRMAFGATAGSIFALMIRYGLRLSAIGLAIGIFAAIALTRFMQKMLVGVTPNDPITFMVMGVLFVGIAAAACWVPARRAAGLDPGIALRDD